MMDSRNQQPASGMQGRKRGGCQQIQQGIKGFSNQGRGGGGLCRGLGGRQGSTSAMPPSQPVIETEPGPNNSTLQMLKQQAQRMVKALREIQKQIKNLEEE